MSSPRDLMFSRIKFPWTLKIHCWGGLGSQLFAWAMAEELARKGFPRKIELILHTSGVTRRESEIDQLDSRIKISKVRDFSVANSQELKTFKNRNFLNKAFLASMLEKLGIVIFTEDFNRISPWTLQLRSHYSHRSIGDQTVLLARDILQRSNTQLIQHADTALHYRLGDLLTLNEKTYIHPERLVPLLNQIRSSVNSKDFGVDVYSDSLEIALDKLEHVDKNCFFRSYQDSAWNTISSLSTYRNFIATNSKISIWVILLRLTHDVEGFIFAPQELELNLRSILNDSNKLGKITFY